MYVVVSPYKRLIIWYVSVEGEKTSRHLTSEMNTKMTIFQLTGVASFGVILSLFFTVCHTEDLLLGLCPRSSDSFFPSAPSCSSTAGSCMTTAVSTLPFFSSLIDMVCTHVCIKIFMNLCILWGKKPHWWINNASNTKSLLFTNNRIRIKNSNHLMSHIIIYNESKASINKTIIHDIHQHFFICCFEQ